MSLHYFLEYLTLPTKFANHNLPSLIKLISYNNKYIHNWDAFSIDFTDHTPCFVTLKYGANLDERKLTKFSFRLLNETNSNNVISAVRAFGCNDMFCKDFFETFSFMLDKFYCNNFPIKSKTMTNKQ